MRSLAQILALLLVAGFSSAGVCVRPIYPYESQVEVQTVLAELQHREVEAHVCGREHESGELWFYPLWQPVEGTATQFWVSARRVPGGAVGEVATGRLSYHTTTWTVSLHPDGGVESAQRYTGIGLKGQTGHMAKWLRKHQ